MSRPAQSVASFLFLVTSLAASPIAASDVHFGYEGAHGPEHWGETCALGQAQSPIDLGASVPGVPLNQMNIVVNWAKVTANVLNNGHTIQVEPAQAAGSLSVMGREFQFRQVHFHTLSEHAVNGQRADMEAHFVHQAADGQYLVVGVLLRAGQGSSPIGDFLARAIMAAPATADSRAHLPGSLHVGSLLDGGQRYFSYDGSLTTPPCSQTVAWLVQADPVVVDVPLAAGQRFLDLIGRNARPVQPLNGRTVYLH